MRGVDTSYPQSGLQLRWGKQYTSLFRQSALRFLELLACEYLMAIHLMFLLPIYVQNILAIALLAIKFSQQSWTYNKEERCEYTVQFIH